MQTKVTFSNRWLPYLLIAPQLAVTLVFFFWPAGQAVWQSMYLPDPFGLSSEYVGAENFAYLFGDQYYRASFVTTAIFSTLVTLVSMSVALFLAVMAESIGVATYWLKALGYDWNHVLNGTEAMSLVVAASAWKQISYNFLFFLAGLQAIPKSVIEAAAIDGASFAKRFWTIVFPLLSPTTFFLLVVNVVYAFFETFAVIHTITGGGPQQDTNILVYKVFKDGFVGQDLGSSAAQSVVLLFLVGFLTVVQFKFIERRVHY